MKNLLILIGIILISISCNPCIRLAKVCPTKDSINYIETVTENPYYTIPDTLYYSMLFECDSNFQVLLRDFEEVNNSINVETSVKEVIRYKEDKTKVMQLRVSLKAITDSILVRDKLIEKLKSEVKTVIVEKEVIKYKAPRWLIYWFIGSLAEHLILFAFLWFKFKTKILGFIK